MEVCYQKMSPVCLYFFSERVVNRWNSLSQDEVDHTSINGFKRALERRRKVEMDFFAKSYWSHLLLGTGVATPGKLPRKFEV